MKPAKGERVAQAAVALGKSVCYLLLFVGMQLLAALPLTLAAGIQSGLGNLEAAQQLWTLAQDTLMLQSALSGLGTIAFVLIFYLVRRKKLSEALWLRPVPAPTLLSCASLAPAMYLVVTVMLLLLPQSWQESYSDAVASLETGGVFAFIAIVLVAPVVEEFIFRGLIMTRLSQAIPGWLAVLLSSAIFGLLHGHPVQFAYAFALGVFFGLLDLRAGSILPSILGHMAFNLIGQIFSLLPDEDGAILAVLGVLLVLAIVLPILDRPAILALFRRAPKSPPPPPPAEPGQYDFDPWDN